MSYRRQLQITGEAKYSIDITDKFQDTLNLIFYLHVQNPRITKENLLEAFSHIDSKLMIILTWVSLQKIWASSCRGKKSDLKYQVVHTSKQIWSADQNSQV